MPTSELAVTGICIGAAVNGMRPVLTHQRVDFSLLAIEQVINNAAKWSYMYNGAQSVPLTVKMTIGMGWGQGPQHSQNLQALYAHIPGLKVVMPATPSDAKGLMLAAIEDDNPVIYIDHRWLHDLAEDVPEGHYRVPIGKARIMRRGSDVSLVTTSYFTYEALRAQELLQKVGVSAEVVDVRSLKPLDTETIARSVKKTGRLLVADLGHRSFGVAGEIITQVAEDSTISLRTNPRRLTAPDLPSPSTPALANEYYPRYIDMARMVVSMVEGDTKKLESLVAAEEKKRTTPLDVPDKRFTGPF